MPARISARSLSTPRTRPLVSMTKAPVPCVSSKKMEA
jgi:hypothetical protein